MVSDVEPNDGSIAGMPWASVFDPDNNFRAIGEIQDRGFRAARLVVDRLIKAVDDKAGAAAPDSAAAGAAADAGPGVDRVLATWQSMLDQLLRSIGETVRDRGSAETHSASVDLGAQRAYGHVEAIAARPGTTATAEVWLHNRGHADLGTIRLRASDLLAHDGGVIGCAAVRFVPEDIPMPPRSSRAVTIEVDLAVGVVPGTYHGTLLVDGHAEVWLALGVTVGAGAA